MMGTHLDLDDVASGHPAAIAELEALRKDAERYRIWRSAYTNTDRTPHAINPMLVAIADAWTPEELDAAIDAAIDDAMTKETP
jgi:hypothetical protein